MVRDPKTWIWHRQKWSTIGLRMPFSPAHLALCFQRCFIFRSEGDPNWLRGWNPPATKIGQMAKNPSKVAFSLQDLGMSIHMQGHARTIVSVTVARGSISPAKKHRLGSKSGSENPMGPPFWFWSCSPSLGKVGHPLPISTCAMVKTEANDPYWGPGYQSINRDSAIISPW